MAGRVGQLLNYSDIARNVGVDTTTVQSWVSLLEENGILRVLEPYYNNINQRLIKTPKIYFEDIGLAVRLQGWNEFDPLLLSPYFGHVLENLALSEITRFFANQGLEASFYFVRSKEQVEIDFLLQLPNHRFIAIEVKTTPIDYTSQQLRLLESLDVNVIEKWVISGVRSTDFAHSRVVVLDQIFDRLQQLYRS